MIPVSDAGEDDPLEVREDGVEVFPLFGGVCRERAANLPGARARENRKPFGILEVIGNPIGQPVSLRAKS